MEKYYSWRNLNGYKAIGLQNQYKTMDTIRLSTWIAAPVERCFLLSLSIDLHVASARLSREEAIDGVTTGLIGEGETVTFQGRHFGMVLRHTSRIDAMRPYTFFCDAMVAGIFPRFIHEHHFATMNDGTRMRDEVRFSAPWGIVGELATKMYVRRHLTALLTERNAMIKRVAESEEWHKYLDGRSMPIPSCAPVQTAVTPRLGAQRLAAGLAGITDLE